jgi:hypothetical protein
MNKVMVAAYCPEDFVKRVDEDALRLKMSRAAYVRLALELALDFQLRPIHGQPADAPEPDAGH